MFWLLGVAGILAVLGFVGSVQATSTRRSLERVHARRLLHLIASSAFDEASVRFETAMGPVPVPRQGERRDLARVLPFPFSVEPEMTRSAFDPSATTVGAVSVVSSPWILSEIPGAQGTRMIQETGILEFHVLVTVNLGSTRLARRVVARRYCAAAASPTSPSARLSIQNTNLAMAVTDP